MPKRKISLRDCDYGRNIRKEIKKLKRMLEAVNYNSDSSSISDNSSKSGSAEYPLDELLPDDQSDEVVLSNENLDLAAETTENIDESDLLDNAELPSGSNETNPPQGSAENNTTQLEPMPEGKTDLDSDVLAILGDDPSVATQYGPEIHKELASRLQHITAAGLTKEARKELQDKYLLPSNGTLIGAPLLNPEIKAALPETLVNRDKAIETKQKLLGSAISCLTSATTELLQAKDKNNELLKKLVDTSRMLCDIQHSDSVTRRMFSLSVLKKDVKTQIQNTKIDKLLFGENLPDTLKTAKAVSRSSAEIKYSSFNTNRNKPSTSKFDHLNSKAPVAPARKPPVNTQRTRQPAYHRNQHNKSFKPSSQPPRPTHQSHHRR